MASTNFVVKNGLTVASGTVVAGGSSGSNGQVLSSTGTGVQWVNASSASGDVVGPASSTDNAIVRFDLTTGKLIQNSTATLSDGGIMIVTELDTDSIKSATANSPIVIAPDGTGDVHLNADSVRIGDNNADATLVTRGTGDLIITTHEGSAVEGIVRLYDGVNGDITLTPNGSGQVKIGTDQVVTLVASQTLTNKTLTSPTFTAPVLGTPASGTLTNCTFPTLNQNTTGSAGSVANTLTISSPLSGTSYNGSSAVSIGIPVATTSANGYLSSTDWTTFNNKTSNTGTVTSITAGTGLSGGVITTSGTITIDSTVATLTGTQTLTNKTLTSPTLTTPALGTPASGTLTNCTFPTLNQNTTGTSANVTGTVAVANGGTGSATLTSGSYVVGAGTSAVTLKTPTQVTADLDTFTYQIGATAGKKGLVPAAPAVGASVVYLDQTGAWTTPSAGGTTTNALTISSPLTGTSFNGSSAVSIGIPAATTSVNGYLTSTDWTTFNNKTSNTGTVTSVAGTGTVSGLTLTGTVTTSGNLTLGGTISTLNQNTTGTAGSISGFNNPTTAATANTIAYRTAEGDIAAREIILSSGLSAQTPTVLVSMYPTTNQLVRTTPAAVAAALSGQTMNITGNATGSSGSCTGNSATATSAATLTTARTINTTSFNGSADITIGSKSNIGTPSAAGTNYYGTIYVTTSASPTGGSTGDLYLVY